MKLENDDPHATAITEAEGNLKVALQKAEILGAEWIDREQLRPGPALREVIEDQLLHATIRVLAALSEVQMHRRMQRVQRQVRESVG
jgi:hypothetical protein